MELRHGQRKPENKINIETISNKEIVIKTIEAMKKGDRATLELLAVANCELVCKIIDLSDLLIYHEYNCGTLAQPIRNKVIYINHNNKQLDKRNPIIKELDSFLGCYDRVTKYFILSTELRKRT